MIKKSQCTWRLYYHQVHRDLLITLYISKLHKSQEKPSGSWCTVITTEPSTLAGQRQTLYCLLYSDRKSKTWTPEPGINFTPNVLHNGIVCHSAFVCALWLLCVFITFQSTANCNTHVLSRRTGRCNNAASYYEGHGLKFGTRNHYRHCDIFGCFQSFQANCVFFNP